MTSKRPMAASARSTSPVSPPAGAYLVVDTGFWIFGKKRLIPAGVVQLVDDEDRRCSASLSKDEIKAAPDFDESHREMRDDYETYYGTYSC